MEKWQVLENSPLSPSVKWRNVCLGLLHSFIGPVESLGFLLDKVLHWEQKKEERKCSSTTKPQWFSEIRILEIKTLNYYSAAFQLQELSGFIDPIVLHAGLFTLAMFWKCVYMNHEQSYQKELLLLKFTNLTNSAYFQKEILFCRMQYILYKQCH